jgi:hypothetical protein
VRNGDHTVTLKFAEIQNQAAGQRKFDVSAEGTLALDDFDIAAAARCHGWALQPTPDIRQ